MGTPGPTPSITLEETLRLFTEGDRSFTPLTATEVAEVLGCTRRTAHRKLEALAERGELETKKAGAHSRIWWRQIDSARSPSTDQRGSIPEQWGEFVDAVEDYAIFVLDPDGHVASWNEGAERIKGYAKEEILGEHLSVFYTDDDVDAGVPEENLKTARSTGHVEDEGWRVREDGSTFWANVVITAIRDDNGEPKGFTKVTRDLTERRELEEKLRRERNQTEELLRTAPIAISVQNAEGETVLANRRAQEVLGLSEREILDDIDEWTIYGAGGEPIEPEETPWARVRVTGAPIFDEEIAIENSSGDRTWFSLNAAPIFDASGNLERVISASEDVSYLKRRERELIQRKSELETELSDTLGRISDAFYALDEEWRFTLVNDQAETILQHSREQLLGASCWDVFPDATGTVVWDRFHEAKESNEPVSFEIEHDSLDIWLKINAYPSETGLSVYFQDVTERVGRERALQSHARQQEAISELGHSALENPDLDDLFAEAAHVVADVLGNEYCKVLDLDPGAAELQLRQGVGWREEIVGGATVSAVEADSQASYTLLSEEPVVVTDLESETRFSGPELLTSHDVRSGISTIIGSRSDPWGVLGTHDTQVKSFTDHDVIFVQSVANLLAEAVERQHYQDELEGMVAKLEESNERLEQFAYVASHDLQEPLRMISNYLQLVEGRYADELDEDGREFIEFAVDGAQRMREMINDLLTYSRIDTEAAPFEPTNVSIVVERVLGNLRMQIEGSGAAVDIGPLPTLSADEKQLEQVFQNLVSNAVKYRSDDPPEIEIGAERSAGAWTFWVADNGIGIDTEHTDRIFEVFNRLHTMEEYSGTGIGLALCEKIVDRHGGEIWVESEPGEGSTFYFTIPVTTNQDELDADTDPPRQTEETND